MSRVAIIGGGPAGMMCASEAAHNGHSVTLYERNEKLGKKLFITGKGRCNLTNSADIKDFFENIPRNSRFLYSALYGFTNDELVAAINAEGVPTKVERGGINVKEIDPSTMESKLVSGLYFAGEVIDVDAYTGGFNIQIACSTGVLAGRSII